MQTSTRSCVGIRCHVFAHLRIHPVGGRAHGKFAERGQVALHEEGPQRPRRLVGGVDLALLQPVDQFVGRQVDQLDLVGHLQHAIGHRLAHAHAGDAGHRLVQGLDVLDVQRGVDIDAGGQYLLDVLPALFMAAAVGIGVRQFVDQGQRRFARQKRVKVHLGQRAAPVDDGFARQLRQTGELGLGFRAAVGFDQRGHNIHAFGALAVRIVQHRPSLAHPGGGAEEHLQPTPAFARGLRQKRLGRRADVGVGRHSVAGPPGTAGGIGKAASRAKLVVRTLTRGSP
jgi:hypothetical protein